VNWTLFKSIGIFLVKAIIHAETLSPQPGTGAVKAATVQDMTQDVITALVGAGGATLLQVPEVATTFKAANDAIVAFQKALSAAQLALPPQPPTQP
jgi:hypothetical protein